MNQGTSQTDICNLALMRLGQRTIQSIDNQTDPNAIACRIGWNQALGEVSREAPWNCIMKAAALVQLAPAPDSPATNPTNYPPGTTDWIPGTNYAVNAYVTYAGTLYQCLIANTSSQIFAQDLTKGYWFQTDVFAPNFLTPSAGNASPVYPWRFAYELPEDFLLLVELNGTWVWKRETQGDLYQVFQKRLYCDTDYANIRYTHFAIDTSIFDPLFIGALEMNLARIMATTLRKDDATLSQRLGLEYERYLKKARVRNAGERNPNRYNIVSQSRFVRGRLISTNG